MAGSLNHIVGENGEFRFEGIENMGDAYEALEECYFFIQALAKGDKNVINNIAKQLKFPTIKHDLTSRRII